MEDGRKQHKKWLEKVYSDELQIMSESSKHQKFIYAIILKLAIRKQTERGFETLVTELLNDIRSLTRITVVSSMDTQTHGDKKYVVTKIKFNAKKLEHDNFRNPTEFVEKFLIPTIHQLDGRPSVVEVGKLHLSG